MGFFGGPSKGTLLTMSQGIAAVAMQIQMLQQAEGSEMGKEEDTHDFLTEEEDTHDFLTV
ncbi:hypothetical protein [Thioalkalivibrio sp. ALE12]|uniref:hypothetical protein n=1 Tax=Thioalkalivibrio sp. ALE12 TaxID=1158170 RepID=UPI0003665CA8|nr:hypothetical protein [Thioalkalivibrio sp. ALE12]